MTGDEMHALEEKALNDPFLAEAMEGYHDQKNIWSEIKKNAALLEENLNTKTKEKKAPVFFIHPGWLRVAAIFIVLLLAGGIAWYTWYREIPATNILADKNIPQIIKKDSTQLPDTTLLADNKFSQQKADTKKLPAEKPGVSIQKDKANDVQAAPVRAMQETVQADSIEELYKKSAIGKAGAPLPFSQKEIGIDTLPNPVGGWEAFNQYVNERVVFYKKILVKNYIPGNIKIDFKISKSGQPANYKIVQSLSPTMDSLAVKILQDGPLWTPSKKNPNSAVEIHF